MGDKVYTKTDTSTNWAKARNFVPKDGELIYYTDLDQFKIGDGKTKVNELEFRQQHLVTEYDANERQLTLK